MLEESIKELEQEEEERKKEESTAASETAEVIAKGESLGWLVEGDGRYSWSKEEENPNNL